MRPAIALVVLFCLAAGPATAPSTQPAPYTSVAEMLADVPENLRPSMDRVQGRDKALQDWIAANKIGKPIDIPVTVGAAGVMKGVGRVGAKHGNDYQHQAMGLPVQWCLVQIFPAQDQWAGLSAFKKGDVVRPVNGRIETLTVKGLLGDSGLALMVEIHVRADAVVKAD